MGGGRWEVDGDEDRGVIVCASMVVGGILRG